MATDILEKIRRAEAEAERLRQEAQAQARDILKASEEASLHAERESDREARTRYRNKLEETRLRIEADLADQRARDEGERRRVAEAAAAKVPEAARYIVGRILADGDR